MELKDALRRALKRSQKVKGPLKTFCVVYPCKTKYPEIRHWIKEKKKQKRVRLHRLAWELNANRQIPKGKEIMHQCDNSRCINSDHLKIGTHLENMLEAKARKRMPRGENHKNSRLTKESVRKIRELYQTEKYRQSDLAKKFKVSQISISNLLIRRTWWWLDEGGFTRQSRRGNEKNWRRKFNSNCNPYRARKTKS